MRRIHIYVYALLAISAPALAETPLADPALEARARALFQEIRCPVCENQSIADSPTELSEDLRAFVRRELARGQSEAQIRTTLRERYGDFLLFRPSLAPRHWLLWGAPLGLFLLLGWLGWRAARRAR